MPKKGSVKENTRKPCISKPCFKIVTRSNSSSRINIVTTFSNEEAFAYPFIILDRRELYKGL